MLLCLILVVRSKPCIAKELKLTVDQVPLNRAYPCSHICLYGRALIRSAGGRLLRVSPKREGYARQLPLAGQTAVAMIASFVLGTRPRLGQVYGPHDGWSHAMAVSGGHRATQGMTCKAFR